MPKKKIVLNAVSEKMLSIINSQLTQYRNVDRLINSCIMFAGFMFHCAHENELFENNLNIVMGIDDFKKFFLDENIQCKVDSPKKEEGEKKGLKLL